mmetsp:Transcript_126931/g.283788  ORF Transcript_126931/g.283788 Transcript_126931/m.283788 type:complete len:231 (+) Transcript_126931:947-1639(+)
MSAGHVRGHLSFDSPACSVALATSDGDAELVLVAGPTRHAPECAALDGPGLRGGLGPGSSFHTSECAAFLCLLEVLLRLGSGGASVRGSRDTASLGIASDASASLGWHHYRAAVPKLRNAGTLGGATGSAATAGQCCRASRPRRRRVASGSPSGEASLEESVGRRSRRVAAARRCQRWGVSHSLYRACGTGSTRQRREGERGARSTLWLGGERKTSPPIALGPGAMLTLN